MNDEHNRPEAAAPHISRERAAVPSSPATGERITCPACARFNPSRLNCLYCGAALPHTAASEARVQALRPRPLEWWEQGFNVILLPTNDSGAAHASVPQIVRAEVERLLGIETETCEKMLAGGAPVPLMRIAEQEQAELAGRRLGALGLSMAIVPDEELCVRPEEIKRVRRIELNGAGLRVSCGIRRELEARDDAGDAMTLPLAEIVALVRGRLFTKQTESARSSRAAQVKAVETDVAAANPLRADEREIATDESVLDIYAVAPACTWRICANSFDYSCLGARRQLLARDNFKLLVEALRLAASTACFDETYDSMRPLLERVWTLTERTEARGTTRRSIARFAVQQAVFVSNEEQFTRHARLCAHLERERRRHQPERADELAPTDTPCT